MKTIRMEVLFPEMSDLYGDTGNLVYLRKKLEKMGFSVETVRTALGDVPEFPYRQVDFLYLGPCTESQQQMQAQALMPYRDALAARMGSGNVTLFTGNAFELLGEYVAEEKGERFPCLGLIPTYAKRFTRLRYNDLSLGNWDDLEIVGYKNQLSHSYLQEGQRMNDCFLHMERGSGLHPDSRQEGFRRNSFFATYLLGPILPLNPGFAERILEHMTSTAVPTFPFEWEAYQSRLEEYRK